ncbi:hypothetical protein ACFQV2_32160 [Actinokineospora soli]|uniref:Uncharacterized protein n=1 Tax=Actinokineospora soli TaxID=1048753 RepID=A0ABW2TX30_9PSEU
MGVRRRGGRPPGRAPGPAARDRRAQRPRRGRAGAAAALTEDAEPADVLHALLETEPGVDPDELLAIGEALGYRAAAAFCAGDPLGRFDAVFTADAACGLGACPPPAYGPLASTRG